MSVYRVEDLWKDLKYTVKKMDGTKKFVTFLIPIIFIVPIMFPLLFLLSNYLFEVVLLWVILPYGLFVVITLRRNWKHAPKEN